MPQVVAAQPGLDVRHGNAERAPHGGAEHRRHRVAVDEDERLAGARQELPAEPPARPRERPAHRREPARDVSIRPQVASSGPAREPEIGLPQPELLEKARDLLDLLAGGREHVAVSAVLEPQEDGRELDQLPRRAEDDEDHGAPFARRCRARSARPRHIPAPCAAA